MSISSGVAVSVLAILLSCLCTSSSIIWMAAGKSQDIEVAQADIAVLKTDVREVMKALPRLEEKSENINNNLKEVSSRLHGISTQFGLFRSESNARSH